MRISDWSSDVCSSDLLTRARLARAAPGALVMHPGPMNRGVEIDSDVADLLDRSIITRHVEMGVAIRKIGRASFRERVSQYVYISLVADYLKKKTLHSSVRKSLLPHFLTYTTST